jgi:hypothetical protein
MPDLEHSQREAVEQQALRETAEWLAWLLDLAIPIPGTRFSLGLDPLIGLLPGIGDALVSLIGSILLVIATKLRMPKIVLVRMSLNVLLNGAVGAIPIVGDLFSVWFRSNARNAAILHRASSSSHPSTVADLAFVAGLVCVTLAILLAAILGILWLVAILGMLAWSLA